MRRAAVRGGRPTSARAALSTVLVLAVTAVLAGCTSGSTPAVPSASRPAASACLWWDISTLTGALAADKSLADEFEQGHPGVTVEVQVMTPDEAHGKFDTAVQTAALAPPDVITVEAAWIPDWSARGYIGRLDNTDAADGAEDVLPSLLPHGEVRRPDQAALRSADGLALLYNPKLLKQAGVAVLRTGTTSPSRTPS